MIWILRELIEPFGLIKCEIRGDFWDSDVKRELGLYVCVCVCVCVCVPWLCMCILRVFRLIFGV